MQKRKFKKLSFILVLGMILSVFAPFKAMAAGDGTVTLDNPREDVEYTLYKVFDLSYQEVNASKAYTYTAVSEDFENELNDSGFSALLMKDSSNNIVRNTNGRAVIDTDVLTNTKNENYINPYDFSNWLYTKTIVLVKAGDSTTATTQDNKLQWTGLELGYYMLASNTGTIVSLDTTDRVATVHEKNPDENILGFTKKVKTETDQDFAESIYANIGETLNYQISFNVDQYANKEYILTDQLPQGIDYINNSLAVTGVESGDYTIDSNFSDTSKNLKITFPIATIRKLAEAAKTAGDSQQVTITYKAKLNNNASISNHNGIEENKNTANLVYDTDKSIEKSASVQTTDFNVLKYTGETTNTLANAKFKLYTTETGGTPLTFKQNGTNQIYYYVVDGETSEIITDATGTFNLKGLKTGTYYLEESKAPEGYNGLTKRIKVEIIRPSEDGVNVTYKVDAKELENSNTVNVENNTGSRLPETGGMGRTLIYAIGGIVFFVALVLLISRNKNKNKQA